MFRFVQFEFPWELGPPDGRYLLRAGGRGDPGDGEPTHVLVLATLGAPERRGRLTRRRARNVDPAPAPTPVATGRATVIDVAAPLDGDDAARAWLAGAGETELAAGLDVLNRALHAFRLATADPYVNALGRRQAIAARVGYGAGEQVAEGRWSAARELEPPAPSRRRQRVLMPQARLAAVLSGREPALAAEELALRARLDLDQARPREASLQLLAALDAALAELPADPHAEALADRVRELQAQRPLVARAADAARTGVPTAADLDAVQFTLGRLEAALRARAFVGA